MAISESDAIELTRSAVKITSPCPHGDVGNTLVRMLKTEITPEEAYSKIEYFIEDYKN